MTISYLITPFLAWFVTGIIKFLVNSFKARRFAFDLIGYGGFPSNHSAIVASAAVLVALKDGIDHPAFGVAVALAFIVILDANSLRNQVGRHATILNQEVVSKGRKHKVLRERMGHSRLEIIAGMVVGACVSFFVYFMDIFLLDIY